MRAVVILFGFLTAAVMVGIIGMLWWNAPASDLGEVPLRVIFSFYVTGPWIAAFLATLSRPTTLRFVIMGGGAALGAAVLVPTYYQSIFQPAGSTDTLSLAVFPLCQWVALIVAYLLVKRDERSQPA